MTTNINSDVIMRSETKNWFVALLNRVFHRTKNNPKINKYHNAEERKIVIEGALNSLIPPVSESMIDVVAQKNKVTEQWQHNKKNNETTSNFESSEQGTQPSSLADAEPTIKSSEENDEMAVAKSMTEMNETEVIDYAKERVAESPLKKTLAGIKFPKRKVVKIDKVEHSEEV
jgi:hypothetical protein